MNNIIGRFLSISLVALSIFGFSAVAGAASSPSPSVSATKLTDAERVSKLKARADKEIDRRVTELQSVLKKVSGLAKVSATDKASFTTQIQAEITNLTTLKAKVDADTDLATLKTDTKSIVTSYRVFALFIPKIHILAVADTLETTATQLDQLAVKLSVQIAAKKVAGQTVTTLEDKLNDLQTNLAAVHKQVPTIISTVLALQPDGYPGNKSALQTAQGMVKTATQELHTARNDAKTIVDALKTMKTTATTTSPSPKTS